MILPLLLLFFFCGVSAELPAYFRTWKSNTNQQVDIYAPGILAISWMTDAGDVNGYFHHLESYSSSPTFLFGRSVCSPYTIVKWHKGQQAIINGGCDFNGLNWHSNASLLLEGQRLFLPITANISQVKYDYLTKRMYLYQWPVLYVYSTREFTRLTAYRLPNLHGFYVSNAHLFYATDEGRVNVYNERTSEHFTLEDAPGGVFERYHMYNSMHMHSGASNNSFLPIFTLGVLVMAMVLY